MQIAILSVSQSYTLLGDAVVAVTAESLQIL
jgi:hypothetical protein